MAIEKWFNSDPSNVYNTAVDFSHGLVGMNHSSRTSGLTVCLLALWALSLPHSLARAQAVPDPISILEAYFNAILDGDWAEARSYWAPGAVALSERLGIAYTDVHAKYDCASPVFQHRDELRANRAAIVIHQGLLQHSYAKIPISVVLNGDSLKVDYYMTDYAGEWRIVPRLEALTRNWSRIETRYAVVHFVDSSRVNDYALAELDRFVDSVALAFGVSEVRRRELAEKKIDYYLCALEDVLRLTGYPVPGMTDLPSDAIITGKLPHYHELTHLLTGYALQSLPLHSLPCLQEGLAVAVGGRWGRSAAVIGDLGAFVLRASLVDFEDVLTYDGFHNSGLPADLSYAASGFLISSLIAEFGVERFFDLYLRLAGDAEAVHALSREAIQDTVSAIYDRSWPQIREVVMSKIAIRHRSGVYPLQGSGDGEQTALKDGVVRTTDSLLSFEFPLREDQETGVLLLDCSPTRPDRLWESSIFRRHLPEETYRGECLGIVFDRFEVGLYDYRTGNLLGKFATGFSDGETIWNPETGLIRFSIHRSLLPDLPGPKQRRLVMR